MGGPSSAPLQEEVRSLMVLSISNTISKLFKVWDTMGVDEHQKRSHAETFHIDMRKLMEDMTRKHEDLMTKLQKSIDDGTEKLHDLCLELFHPIPKLEPSLKMVQREKMIYEKVEELVTEKKERVSKLKSLQSEDLMLSKRMDSTPYETISALVPSIEQLDNLETHIKTARLEKETRENEFLSQKQKITDLYKFIGVDPEDPFANGVVHEDAESFKLTIENMEKLKDLVGKLTERQDIIVETDGLWDQLRSLWNILETPDLEQDNFKNGKEGYSTSVISALKAEIALCSQLKMQKFVERIREELRVMWEKCYFSVEQQNSFRAFYDQNCTEKLLQTHKSELEKMKTYYETNKYVLQKIEEREKLFQQMVIFDEKSSDPNRLFTNRKGIMLQEEKARKKMTDLPKLEEEVTSIVKKWEKENKSVFLVRGCSFVEYTKKQWADFNAAKKKRRQDRLKNKEEIQNRPNRKRVAPMSTPSSKPLKTKKLNDNIKTPYTTSRTQHNTTLQSSFSRKPLTTPSIKQTKQTVNASKGTRASRLLRKVATDKRRKSKLVSHTPANSENQTTSALASTGSCDDIVNEVSNSNCQTSAGPSSVQ